MAKMPTLTVCRYVIGTQTPKLLGDISPLKVRLDIISEPPLVMQPKPETRSMIVEAVHYLYAGAGVSLLCSTSELLLSADMLLSSLPARDGSMSHGAVEVVNRSLNHHIGIRLSAFD